MKAAVMFSTVFALAIGLSPVAHANDKAKDDPACAGLVKSCEAAGFALGAHKTTGKGVWADCVHKLARGKTVAGVTATQSEAEACQKAAKADRAANKAERAEKKK